MAVEDLTQLADTADRHSPRRRVWRLTAGLAIALTSAGCAARQPKPSLPIPDLSAQISAADELLRGGCFTCLQDALRGYETVSAHPNASTTFRALAALGAARAGILLDARQRELGMVNDHFLDRARRAAETSPEVQTKLAAAFEIVDYVPWRVAEAGSASDEERAKRSGELAKNRDAWKARYSASAGETPFDAYVWLMFACESGLARTLSREELARPFASITHTPLLAYKLATCPRIDTGTLQALLDADPRFVEVTYFLGTEAILRGKPDEAEPALVRAHEWRQSWPAVTLSLANISFTEEDFPRALRFYDETLQLAPGQRGAMLGRIRSLTNLGRHDEAIAECDAVLRGPWDHGDAFYWRAWNNLRLGRIDEARTDVQAAKKLWINADVAKLAGVVAYRQQQLEVATSEFKESHRLNPDDCETAFNLAAVHIDQRRWQDAVETFLPTATCLEEARARLEQDIAKIQASTAPDERKARQVTRRQQQIATAQRMLATAWFDTALAYSNLSRPSDARVYAEKVASDPEFGARAQELLKRLSRQDH